MKRAYVAIGILVTLMVACALSLAYQRRQTDLLVSHIDTLIDRFQPEDPAAALADTEAFLQEYDKQTAWFPLFSRHATLTDVKCELASLPVLLKKGEPLDYTAALCRCRERLCAFYRLELPLLENIL